MLTHPTLQKWFDLTKDDPITLCPEAINHEAISNMWVWGCLDADDPALNMASVSQFILEVIENRRSALHASASPSMRFYCWIDALAGQLRFSLVSTAHGRLPFGCQIVETTDIGNIVQLYLNLCLCLPEWVAPVTWDEEEEMNKPFVLSVFAVTLP